MIIESSRDFFEAPDTQVGFWVEAEEGFLSRFRHFILRYSSSRNITIKRILLLLLRTEEQQALLLLYCSLATQTASSSSTKSSVPLRLSRCYCVLVVGLLLLLLLYEKVSSQTVDSQLSSKRELRSGKSCSCVP